MRCRSVEQELSLRHDGLVNATVEREIDTHLAGCAACRRFAEGLNRIAQSIAAMEPAAAIEPTHIAAEAVRQWREGAAVGARRSSLWRPLGLAGCAAAAALLLFVATRPHGPASPSGNVAPLLANRSGSLPIRTFSGVTPVPKQSSPELAANIVHGETRTVGSHRESVNQRSRLAVVTDLPKDDIAYVNQDAASIPGRWARLLPDENARLQADLMRSVRGGDDFVSVPLPQLAGISRSSFAAARRAWQAEKAVVDPRLVHRMTVAAKGQSFADLCRQWKEETGIDFSAARTVADDKVTIFCKEKPLRDVMRQITQVFGYLWRRSGEEGQYQYELYQDLKSQLVEEELRNRDRNEALMALDKEMEKYRKYLNLSPDEARAMAENASPDDKHVLEQLGGTGWGPAHLYFGLGADQMAALRSGQPVEFSSSPESGQAELPQSMRGNVLSSVPNAHVYQDANGNRGLVMGGNPPPGTTSIPLGSLPDARANASLRLNSNELGQLELEGGTGFGVTDGSGNGRASMAGMMADTMAVGVNPSVKNPENSKANRDLARDPSLSRQVQTEPESHYEIESRRNRPGGPRVTSADVLEALYKKTGIDIVSDSFLKLYDPSAVSVNGNSLFDALNRSCDSMRVRWTKGDGWLRFRSASYFNDRLKEIPNRLLSRWQESRKANGMLTVDDLMQIASLTDAQLNAAEVAEAVKAIFGLKEWELGAGGSIRPQWRFLAAMPSTLRGAALSEKGITFPQLPVALQQQYVALALGRSADRIPIQLSDLATATLRVEFPYPAPKKDGRRMAAAAPVVESAGESAGKGEPDVRFTYKFGSPNVATWTHEIGPHGSSFGSESANGRMQSADTNLRGARP
jgi:hypothetical protein